MKYIRTESNYIGTKKDYIKLCGVVKKLAEKYGEECDKIIKETNTIEELCDEFVIENNGNCISDLYTIKRLLVKNKVVVYGAIWTEWGLKYVAKMNDKGELELL